MSVVDTLKKVRWYVHEVMGDNAYAKFVAHQRTHHPGAPIPTEREFWAAKHKDAELNPRSRCC
ncbi:hypothetical protein GCM10027418_11240 [Mariniluteicoccus endophyticus]